MKGGYQILNLSTVTVGTKTKTKGSFEQAKGNNGKPVMVLTPDNQRVFAEVVESSGDYILAYLGGDGSTYTVLVEDDDNVTITKQESDATIATKVAALETAVGDVTDLDTTSKEVVGAINEVKGKLAYSSLTFTPQYAYSASATFKVEKFGRIVVMTGSANSTDLPHTQATLYTLPEEYRPTKSVEMSGYIDANNKDIYMGVSIGSDGNIVKLADTGTEWASSPIPFKHTFVWMAQE